MNRTIGVLAIIREIQKSATSARPKPRSRDAWGSRNAT
jgi:hypothetical protein